MIDDTQVSKDVDGLDNIDSFWDSARLGASLLAVLCFCGRGVEAAVGIVIRLAVCARRWVFVLCRNGRLHVD